MVLGERLHWSARFAVFNTVDDDARGEGGEVGLARSWTFIPFCLLHDVFDHDGAVCLSICRWRRMGDEPQLRFILHSSLKGEEGKEKKWKCFIARLCFHFALTEIVLDFEDDRGEPIERTSLLGK